MKGTTTKRRHFLRRPVENQTIIFSSSRVQANYKIEKTQKKLHFLYTSLNMKCNKNSKFLFTTVSLLLLHLCSSLSFEESDAIESLLNRLNTKKPSPSQQESAARGVLQRLLPTHLSSFEFKVITKVFLRFSEILYLVGSCFLNFPSSFS